MYRCKDYKGNPSHVMCLVRVVVFEDCPAFLIVIFILSLKKESQPCFGQKLWQRIHSHHHSWTAEFDCTIDFEEASIRNSSNQKKILNHLWNLHEGHHMWNQHESLGLLMVSKSFVQHVAWNGINLLKCESMVTKYFSRHNQNES